MYMASKGLNFDTWLGSIDDGCKGDVFTLFCLCMLQDVHATIHLRNGKYWSSMNDPSSDHHINIDHSHVHLAYLGRGLYIELVKRDTPLKIINDDSKDLIVLGILESDAQATLDLAINQGLGVALDRTAGMSISKHVQVKIEPSPTSPKSPRSPKPSTLSDPRYSSEPSTSTSTTLSGSIQISLRSIGHMAKTQPHLAKIQLQVIVTSDVSVIKLQKSLCVSITKLDIKEGVRLKVREDMLTRPLSLEVHDECSTEGYESTETEIYWPLSPKRMKEFKIAERATPGKTVKSTLKHGKLRHQKGNLQSKQFKKRMIYAKPSQFMFKIHTVGIKKKKTKYYFKCVDGNCDKTFDKLQTWNTHHRLHHKSSIRCTICWKSFDTPSVARSHKNSHAPQKHKCTQCNKAFAYSSALRLHRNTHIKQKHHKCFHGNCRKSYQWPQDLSRHIQ